MGYTRVCGWVWYAFCERRPGHGAAVSPTRVPRGAPCERVNALCLISSGEIMTAVTALPEVGSAESLCGREARGLFDTQRDRAPLV